MSLNVYAQNLSHWANQLNADNEWSTALESAFDSIGFTEDYIERAATATAKQLYRRKAIKDNVWGMVDLDPCAAWLIDSPLMQRLRYVKQLGVSYLTYPGAQHTRFEHSIGVFHVVNRLLTAFKRNKQNEHDPSSADSALIAACYEDEGYDASVVRLAALLHDVGHIPFSHACERFFQGNPEATTIGPYSTKLFLSRFQTAYRGIASGEKVLATREKKELSEVFSAAIVLSNRFRAFLEKSYPRGFEKPYDQVTCDIAALILGDPISDHDRALPQLISGPFDADKIDYMLRDAHACGLDLGIDVSRLFFRASVYEVRRKEAISEQVPALIKDAPLPFLTFLLDQSGTDTALEMGFARLSLYTRVYYHQLTLNAEAQLTALLDLARSQSTNAADWSNFLHVWSHSDQSLLFSLVQDSDDSIKRAARNILERRLLKRAACFSIDLILPSALGNTLPTLTLQDSLASLHEQAHDKLVKAITDSSTRANLEEQIKQYCRIFRAHLLQHGEPATNLPSEDAPEFVRFILPGESKRALLPQALIITPSREVSQQRQRDPSYLDSGRLASQKGYVLVPSAWRELALLAFQRSIYDLEDLAIIREAEPIASAEAPCSASKCQALFRPILAVPASANVNVKSRPSDANYFQSKLSPREVEELKAKSLSFSFAVGNDKEQESLSIRMRTFAETNGLRLCSVPFYFGRGLSEHSGAADSPSPINSDLREFLRTVGRHVIRRHVTSDGRFATKDEVSSECERRALGYANAEGMLATSLNVPSSTYTALWCPGTYVSANSSGREIPWLPLLIRDGHEASAIVF